jgi:menaquinone-dependent protoporphyrinogen oxidase
MRILIVYGTTEGHTRDLGGFAAGALREAGHEAVALEAPPAARDLDLAGWDAIVVAASVHVGRYQPAIVGFASARRNEIARMPNAFISVSLSAAGTNEADWKGLEACVAKFERETGWMPGAVHHAAGAIRYSRYGFLKRLALKLIARKRGKDTVTRQDYDLTDYDALRRFLLDFARSAAAALDAGPASGDRENRAA